MANLNLTNKVIIVYTEIAKKTVNPTFSFPKGGATALKIGEAIQLIQNEYGSVSIERLVDYCIFVSHFYRDNSKMQIKQVFGKTSVTRFTSAKSGLRYYEDQWLKAHGLSRLALIDMVQDKSQHPQAKFIYLECEESTKLRMLNKEIGYIICQTSTLGWSPLSEACGKCHFVPRCKKETECKYPELFRIRIENGETNK